MRVGIKDRREVLVPEGLTDDGQCQLEVVSQPVDPAKKRDRALKASRHGERDGRTFLRRQCRPDAVASCLPSLLDRT